MVMSMSTASGRHSAYLSTASRPFSARATSYPLSSSTFAARTRINAASSTTRIRAMARVLDLHVVVRAADGAHSDPAALARVEPHTAALRTAQVAPGDRYTGLCQAFVDWRGIRGTNAPNPVPR